MTVIHQWTLELAKTVAPDEVYLAPSLADSYIENLQTVAANDDFQPINNNTFSHSYEPCDMRLMLPLVIHSIGRVSDNLIQLLSSETTHSIVTNVIPLATLLIQFKECSLHEKAHHQQGTVSTFVDAQSAKQKIANDYPACRLLLDDMSKVLNESGIPEQVAEITALKTLHQFLTNPKSGLDYLRALRK